MRSTLNRYERKALSGIPGTYNSFLFRSKKFLLPILIAVALTISIIISAINVSPTMDFTVDKPTLYYRYSDITPEYLYKWYARREKISEEEIKSKLNIERISTKKRLKDLYFYYGLNESGIDAILVDKNGKIIAVYYKTSSLLYNPIRDMKTYGAWEEK